MIIRIAVSLILLTLGAARSSFAETGILLLAHGGGPEWNARVDELVDEIDKTNPTEVAYGMATRANLQAGVDRLVARGVTEIVAVPLFVSSWSSVITSTEYLLGQRDVAPPALAVFAKMSHGTGGRGKQNGNAAHDDHSAHRGAAPAVDGTKPVESPVPIRMTPALNDHPIVAEILASRAREIGEDPSSEALVIVAHGPNEEKDNQKWLADMRSLAQQLSASAKYASVDYLTVRDDAPKPIWEKAKAELRGIVEKRTAEGRRVLVVPLLISFGGVEKGLRERLDGLTYEMARSGLMPDARLARWVLQMTQQAQSSVR
jgi:sirohydrochlorin cobaltochelatase